MESIRQLISQLALRERDLKWFVKMDDTFGLRYRCCERILIPRLLVLKPPHDSPESVLLRSSI